MSKSYGRAVVLDDVGFVVRPGEVVGFLGPNGAGKSTTMRVLLGLTRPDRGAASVDGVPVRDVPNPGLAVGALLDAGAAHRGRTVRETMRLVTLTLGLAASSGDDWLERVGLSSVRGRRVGALSLGMRQRLGIAIAMVAEPSYLVLDEPMNGLDTEGIGWVKELLRSFARGGGGVLISTHLIGELDGLADRAVVIDRGRVVADVRPDELDVFGTCVRSADDDVLAVALTAAGLEHERTAAGFVVQSEARRVGEIALSAGVALEELRVERTALSTFVLERTSGAFAARSGDMAGVADEHDGTTMVRAAR